MALLYRSVTLARMWTILEGDSAFTTLITQSRRVKGDDQNGWLKRLVLKSPQDYPFVDLAFGDTFSGGPIPFSTFAAEGVAYGTNPTDEWVEARASDMRIRIYYDQKKADDDYRDAVEMACIEAFESAGRNLGIEYIRSWGPWRGRYAVAQRGNIVQPLTEIVIPISYEFSGSQV